MDDATSARRTCEVCGGRINRDNVYGICISTRECRAARYKKKQGEQPAETPCDICGRPIRSDNKIGVCERRDSPECLKERTRRLRERGAAPLQHCEICGRRLRRDNSLGVCSSLRPECARERDRRRRAGLTAPRGWVSAPYISADAVFGRLTVLEDVPLSNGPVSVQCECGTQKTLKRAAELMTGKVRSCGCLRRELHTSHGMTHHPLYRTWHGIIDRCTKPDTPGYENYGGRGIKICDRWMDVRNFIEDIEHEIGQRPEGVGEKGWPLYSLDRVDNDRGYEPGNVRWGTQSQQISNQRRVGKVTRERDALAAQVEALTAQIQTLTAQIGKPGRRRSAVALQGETLF